MWIFYLRIFLSIAILVSVVVLFAKKIIYKNQFRIIIIAVAVTIVVCINTFPFEQIFLKANSVEELFTQMVPYGNVENIVYGKDSCMLTTKVNSSSITHYYFLKTEDGYKPLGDKDVICVEQTSPDNGLYQIYNVLETQDYYLTGHYIGQNDIKISDNLGSEFSLLSEDTMESSTFSYFYFVEAYLNSYSLNYSLIVNGREIIFE